jgi:signal transduction histidine kinase
MQDMEWVRVEICDDGKGLPKDGPKCRSGLLGISERLNMVGGKLELTTNTGTGLCLAALLPLSQTNIELLLPKEALA